jgi:hypothetical protein
MTPADIVRAHFWVTSHPFCEAVLFICTQRSAGAADPSPAIVRVFDCDGEAVNEAEVSSDSSAPLILELDSLLERCKMDSGLRHGHLMVEHSTYSRPILRLQNRGGAVMSGASRPVTKDRAVFSPVTLSPERVTLATLVNHGATTAQVRVRLMFSNRNPDIIYEIPPFGSKVVALEEDFRQALLTGFAKRDSIPEDGAAFPETRGYVRVSVKNDQAVGFQLVESLERGEQGNFFSALSW